MTVYKKGVVCSRGASPDYIRLTGRNFPAEQRQP